MKQVLVRGGGVVVDEVPAPELGPREILVRVHYSCVSVGTELSSVQLSGMPLYRRALKQPQHAKRALEVAREQGVVRTYKRISGQLAGGTADRLLGRRGRGSARRRTSTASPPATASRAPGQASPITPR